MSVRVELMLSRYEGWKLRGLNLSYFEINSSGCGSDVSGELEIEKLFLLIEKRTKLVRIFPDAQGS